jgi:HECT-like Ubiquitin-conjugating enzyme (E2)-binding
LRRKNQLIYCKRCLQLLGETSNQNVTKFWWESIKFQDKLIFDVSPIELVKNVISNHLACDVYIAPIVKMIFETKIPTDDKKLHILIQVMDKNLQLMQLNMESMKLVERKAIKVMFLKLTEGIPEDDRTLNFWQKDLHVTNFELSFKMFHLILEYLETQSELIPGVYRNSNNGFQLTYIDSSQ